MKAGYFHIASSDRPSLFSRSLTDSGLMIVSRFPIVQQDEFTFSKYYDVDGLSSKGILYAKILIGDSYLYLFNSHTNAHYIHPNFEKYKESVNKKIAQLD